MPDTYSPQLNLRLIEPGTSEDVWGSINNANLVLIDNEIFARRTASTNNAANANSRVLKAGDTMTGTLTAPVLAIDANFHLTKSADLVALQLDSNDALHFNRTSNTFALLIGNQAKLTVNAADAVCAVPLTLNVGATAAAHAVRKDYADAQHSAALGVANTKVPIAGGTMTGDLALTRSAAPTTGAVFFGNSGSRYLFWDGANYILPGGSLYVSNSNPVWHTGNLGSPAKTDAENVFTQKQQIYMAAPHLDFHWPNVAIWRLQGVNNGNFAVTNAENAVKLLIDPAGNVTAANFVTTSDERVKTDVRPIAEPLLAVETLRGVSFVRTDAPHRRRVGLIAQDVEAIVPEAVFDGGDGLKGVDYGGLVGLLVAAVQELSAKVRKLDGGEF